MQTRLAPRLVRMFESAANYLIDNVECSEDRVPHNGRRAYLWTILKLLRENSLSEQWMRAETDLAAKLFADIKKSPSGEWVIYPGSQDNRNLSTNAIDCGIVVDAYYDMVNDIRNTSAEWADLISKVALTYNAKKVNGNPVIQNQILWCSTGLARWYKETEYSHHHEMVEKILKRVIKSWLSYRNVDGSFPYMTDKHQPWLWGTTTYYHSREIAFASYIANLIEFKSSALQRALLLSTKYLLKMYTPAGTKQLGLESKRYYFWNDVESGSHPFDIYAFYLAFEQTHDITWKKAAGASLESLLKIQFPAPSTGAGEKKHRNTWQCPTMRMSHVAWLARIPVEFLNDCLDIGLSQLHIPDSVSKPSSLDSLVLIGNSRQWIHFTSRKTPLSGWAGQRANGLLVGQLNDPMNLRSKTPLAYQISNNPIVFLRKNSILLIKSLRHALFSARYLIRNKRQWWLALQFIKQEFFNYSLIAATERRSEFVCKLSDVNIKHRTIEHRLEASDVIGENIAQLGNRTIIWNDEVITVVDRINRRGVYKVLVPEGWEAEVNGKLVDGPYIKFSAPTKVIYSFSQAMR